MHALIPWMAASPSPRHGFTRVLAIGAAALALTLACRPARAEDPLAESLHLTRSTGSLPVWEKPDDKAMAALADKEHSFNKSVFIIGHPDAGYGTGFVISKEHRLLATNAHVADILHQAGELFALGNESTRVFTIDRVWYHPGVIRTSKGGMNVRSQNPADGDVYPQGPDVAVLHVAGDDELPQAFPLADRDELPVLLAMPCGMIGFPGHDTVSWPGVGHKAEATYRQGVIARLTDFYNEPSEPQDRQFIQHTMASFFGFSGSPIFLANGHVAALNNSGGTVKNGDITAQLSYGVRVDCLWELLAYHHLDDQVPIPLAPDELRLSRFEGDDPKIKEFQEVRDSVQRASILTLEKRFTEASELLNEAVHRAPNYATARRARRNNYHQYVAATCPLPEEALRRGIYEDMVRQLTFALEDAKQALRLNPASVEDLLEIVAEKQGLALFHDTANGGELMDHPEDRPILQKVIELDHVAPEHLALAYFIYGGSYSYFRDQLPWQTKAIQTNPYESAYYSSRSQSYQGLHEAGLAAADHNRAEQLKSARLADTKAWRMATSPHQAVRNGPEAVSLAEQACQTTGHAYSMYVDTLAAAHAEVGAVDEAVRWATEALKLAPEERKSDIAGRLRSYRNHKPWRD